jgi:hypothetical protein
MAQPSGGDALAEAMAELRRAGVDLLVSLQTDGERHESRLLDEPAAAVQAGLEFHELPIVDFGVPERSAVAPLVDLLVARLRAGRHVAVHCWAGIGRSSLVAGAILVRLGVPSQRAWVVIGEARGCRVPETDEQREWLVGHGSTVGSPRVLAVSWGRIEVEGVGVFKDAKLYPGGAREWDWNETGTRHQPGVQVADVEELIEHGATVILLSRGMQLQLAVPESTVESLRERGITVHVAETTAAVEKYNELAGSQRVGGLFHTTC